MMKKLLPYLRPILASAMLLLFIGHVGSITLFYHTHIINGQRITHSHPYSQTPDSGTHTHTKVEVETIFLLSALLLLPVALGYLIRLFDSRIPKSHNLLYVYYHNKIVTTPSLRAPPALVRAA